MSLLGPFDAWKAPPPKERKVAWLKGVTYAHRGLHGIGAPENSPTAFARAIEKGLGIECDVQRSNDGQPMVFHDAELERLTGQKGQIGKLTSDQLVKIRLAGSTDTIPHLRDLLEQIDGTVPLLIEIKSHKTMRINAFCLAVRRTLEGYLGQHAVMSFDPRVSHWFREHSPLTVRGLVMTEENDKALPGRLRRHKMLWYAKPDFLAYDIRDLPSRFAESQRQRGIPVLTWTVRDADHRERATEWADAPIAEGFGLA